MKKANASEYFPQNYVESRRRFLNDAEKIAAPVDIGSWKIPSKTDSDLTVDHVWMPPLGKPKTLLTLITGIHGSETYAGSALLDLFMQEILPEINREHVGIFIVHAMNPYGFKNHQRCTENKVNLNRNFSVSGELFKKQNVESKRMHELFYEKKPVSSPHGSLMRHLREVGDKTYFGDISYDQLVKSISPGQFEHPEHLEYGGRGPEPQTQMLTEFMRKIIPQFQDIIALDIHTGLGDRGRLHLLTDGQSQTLNKSLFDQILHPEEDKEFYVFTPPATEGFYQVHGATNSLFGDLATKNQRVCAITLEYGTLGHSREQKIRDWNNFMTEHQGHNFGYTTPEVEKTVRQNNFERSYPNDTEWKKSILLAGEGLIRRIVERI